MATGPRYVVSYRRKRQGRTNYVKRINLLKSYKSRLVIRKTNTQFIVQVVSYHEDGDKILKTYLSSKVLKELGWKYSFKSLSAAYLFGIYVGKELTKNTFEVVVDLGMNNLTKGCSFFSILKGVIDSGYALSVDEEMFPSKDRLFGKHIANYLDKNSGKFSTFNISSKEYLELFDKIKSKLIK